MSGSRVLCALSIAGSDSGGGAGIQADLKAFARCGVHGATAITAITAQNTLGVSAIHAVPADMIVAQVQAVISDLNVAAIKVGMLGTTETVSAVARALREVPDDLPVVVDPVMVAESGARLLDEEALHQLVADILPRAAVATPNLAEAIILTGREEAAGDVQSLARSVQALGPSAVVVTGGHRAEATDVLHDGLQTVEIPGRRYAGGAAHGSGCTHSSVLAARLAQGASVHQAAVDARRLAGEAVRDGLQELGGGPGPVNVLGLGRAG